VRGVDDSPGFSDSSPETSCNGRTLQGGGDVAHLCDNRIETSLSPSIVPWVRVQLEHGGPGQKQDSMFKNFNGHIHIQDMQWNEKAVMPSGMRNRTNTNNQRIK